MMKETEITMKLVSSVAWATRLNVDPGSCF